MCKKDVHSTRTNNTKDIIGKLKKSNRMEEKL